MADSDRDQRERDKLRGYVAASRQLQRRLVIAVAVATAVALAAFTVVPTAAAFGLLAIGCVAVCGFWITTSHITDWRAQLARLDRRSLVAKGAARDRWSPGRARDER